MPPPSELGIATKAVERLVKEESFYRSEMTKQEERVRKLAAEIAAAASPDDLDSNAEFVLKQEARAVEETKAVFGPLKQRTEQAVATLEEQIALAESQQGRQVSSDELEKARTVLSTGQAAVAKED